MSTHELKPGDRVRLTGCARLADYQSGDRGRVLRVCSPWVSINGQRCYCVAMDKDGAARKTPVFTAEEIEPDV
jgi:hypothetical protein